MMLTKKGHIWDAERPATITSLETKLLVVSGRYFLGQKMYEAMPEICD